MGSKWRDSDIYAIEEGSFTSKRGYPLHTFRVYPKEAQPCKGVLFFHHGFSEHAARHIPALGQLCSSGFTICTFDTHGHGRSGPFELRLRALVIHWRALVEDFTDYIRHVLRSDATLPRHSLFVGGHSMGGLAAALTVAHRPPDLPPYAGLFLSSALTSLGAQRTWPEFVQVLVLTLLNQVAPTMELIGRRPPHMGIRNVEAQKEILEDPLWYRGKIKVRTVITFLSGCAELQRQARSLTLPVHAHHGTLDKSIPVATIHSFLGKVGATDQELYIVQDGLHDLTHDPETDECIRRLRAWMLRLTAAGKATAGAGQAVPNGT